MRHLHFAAGFAALALAGCQQTVDEQANIAFEEANVTVRANDSAPLAPAAKPAPATLAIPQQFRGRWGLNTADCTSTRGDAKGLLEISHAQLAFYESRGAPSRLLGATATSFDADYAFLGEGQSWQRVERLTLANGTLRRRTDAEAGQEPAVDLIYQRCAEQGDAR